ncbi:hypothetical protein CMO83_04715 [Candidatus Woesearchaeota archaeon]|jgi:hypothetical protein|nr:hypothetical protein [Candidatus Woesearchaeota archaeon]|tara:strand:- start:17299 stop:17763 length:465 start_codon:yes stop_codon:yes gene_type:complete
MVYLGVLQSTAFVAQIVKGAGAGAWAMGITALASFIISVLALFKGEKKFSKLDWGFFASALLAILLWWITKEPLLSVILVTITDALASLLTSYKSYYKPLEESATYFALSSIKWIAGIFALNTYVVVTWLYPASLIVTNSLIVLVLIIRRSHNR